MADQVADLQAQLAAALARIVNLESTATAAATAPPTATFALNPAHAITGIINFTDAAGIKLYKAAVSPLAILFDGTIKTLRPMLNLLDRRVSEYNASVLITIPVITTAATANTAAVTTNYNLIKESRLCDFNSVKDMSTNHISTNGREKQLNNMFATLMFNSMNTDGALALENSGYDYNIQGEASFPLLIKSIIQLCEVDTFASSFLVREQMSALPSKIVELQYDIKAFNMHVNDLIKKLKQSGEKSDDLFLNVLNSYKICPDQDFKDEYKVHSRKYKEGQLPKNVDELMKWGLKHFNELTEAKTYGQPSKQDQEIIALTAKLEKAEKSHQTIQKQLTQITKSGGDNTNKKKNGGNKKKDGGNNKKKFDAPDWGKPTGNDSRGPRKYKEEDWYYCSTHQAWVKHKPAECRKKIAQEAALNQDQGSGDQGSVSAANALIDMLTEAASQE